jgi:hypothetical protein
MSGRKMRDKHSATHREQTYGEGPSPRFTAKEANRRKQRDRAAQSRHASKQQRFKDKPKRRKESADSGGGFHGFLSLPAGP